jgi:Raf kinase inhibitor-like YbhB/YbcL family protein
MIAVTNRSSLLFLMLIVFGLTACETESGESPASIPRSQETFETATSTPMIKSPEAPASATLEPSRTPADEPTLGPTETPVPPTPSATSPATLAAKPSPVPIGLTSSAFEPGGIIPERHARNGDNLSPPLTWSDPPKGTESYAILFVSDPVADAGGTWILWALYNIPADIRSLSEGLMPDAGGTMETGGQHLENSYMEMAYSGPSPHPIETRRYYMRFYALDTVLETVDIERAAASVDTWIGGTELT